MVVFRDGDEEIIVDFSEGEAEVTQEELDQISGRMHIERVNVSPEEIIDERQED